MSSGGPNQIVVHGVIRPTPIKGQTYSKPSVSAPLLIGAKGGLVVEGIDDNLPLGSVVVTDYTVTNVQSVVLTANVNRRTNIFQNNSSQNVYLAFDGNAVAGSGLTLYPYMSWEPNDVFQGIIRAIVSSGTARLTVLTA